MLHEPVLFHILTNSIFYCLCEHYDIDNNYHVYLKKSKIFFITQDCSRDERFMTERIQIDY